MQTQMHANVDTSIYGIYIDARRHKQTHVDTHKHTDAGGCTQTNAEQTASSVWADNLKMHLDIRRLFNRLYVIDANWRHTHVCYET